MPAAAFAGQSAQLTMNYIQNVLPQAAFYTPCLHPGLWLQVPAEWKWQHDQHGGGPDV